jgi:folate-binding protein YgfZ
MTLQNSTRQREYDAARHEAGVVDKSARGKIGVAGRDRAGFLHALLTNDIQSLRPGEGCYAALLTPQGRMIADMAVFELDDLIMLDVDPSVKDVLLQRLEQSIFSEEVLLEDLTARFAELAVVGPNAPAALRAAVDPEAAGDQKALGELEHFEEYQSVRVSARGRSILIARMDDAGERGFTLLVDHDAAPPLRQALQRAGAREISAETAEVLRVEMGRPAFGRDMDEDTIPLEAGIEKRAISFTKGCYVGQEVIVRVLHRGHGRVARKLVGLTLDGATVADPGDRLFSGEREIGRVTSAVFSPSVGRPIALGYVNREYVTPGTEIEIAHGDRRIPTLVTEVPFVRKRLSPRPQPLVLGT